MCLKYICSNQIPNTQSIGVRFSILKKDSKYYLFVLATSICYVFDMSNKKLEIEK